MPILSRSFAPSVRFDHGVSVRTDTADDPAYIRLAVGGSREVSTRLSPELARAIAAELIAHADRVERGPSVTVIPIGRRPPRPAPTPPEESV